MFTKLFTLLTLFSFTAQAAYFPTVTVNNFDQFGVYNLTLPVLTDGGMSRLQLDSTGHLLNVDTHLDASWATLLSNTPALGQATMANSSPVVIASDQSSIPVTNPSIGLNGAAIPTSSTQIAAEDASGNLQQLKVDASSNLNVNVNSSVLPTGSATLAEQLIQSTSLSSIDTKLTAPLSVTGPLTDTELRASAVPVSAASLPLPTGAATLAEQQTQSTSLSSIDTKLTSPLTVTGPLTDTQLRASAVPVSAASLPLPTGAATEGKQDAQIVIETAINSKLANDYGASTNALRTASQVGNASGVADFGAGTTSAQTLRVVLPTDQSAIPITGSITATNPSVGLNGAAIPTSATQIGASDGTNLKQLLVDGSSNLKVNVQSSALPTGASTSALQSSVQGSATGGTAATASTLTGGVYNTSAPTLTNGQQVALQLDVNGNLKTVAGVADHTPKILTNLNFTSSTATTGTVIYSVPANSYAIFHIGTSAGANTVEVRCGSQPIYYTTAATQLGTSASDYYCGPGQNIISQQNTGAASNIYITGVVFQNQ